MLKIIICDMVVCLVWLTLVALWALLAQHGPFFGRKPGRTFEILAERSKFRPDVQNLGQMFKISTGHSETFKWTIAVWGPKMGFLNSLFKLNWSFWIWIFIFRGQTYISIKDHRSKNSKTLPIHFFHIFCKIIYLSMQFGNLYQNMPTNAGKTTNTHVGRNMSSGHL